MKKIEFHIIQERIEEQMKKALLSPKIIDEFIKQVKQVYRGLKGKVPWEEVGDLRKEDIVSLEDLSLSSIGEKHLHSLLVLKLNGGLGTSMGLSMAKSLIPIKEKENFLEISCQQIQAARQKYKAPILGLFMNSFNTQGEFLDTLNALTINQDVVNDFPSDFLQNQAPRLHEESLLPLDRKLGQQAWCPPGHGDIFFALESSGLLERLLELGYNTAFISNGDNLGAVVDPRILEYLHKEKLEWISEITPKTAADLKGGAFFRPKAKSKQNTIELLEIAQVPEDHAKDFQSIRRFKYFNVNNIWINLQALDKKLKENSLNLSLIVNPKKVDEKRVLQLESAMGSAICSFTKSRLILVDRRRFSPVKSCADLLVRRSDACILDPESYALLPHDPKRLPLVSLSDEYKELTNFEKLFPHIPSLREVLSLKVKGPLCFDIPVTLRGKLKFQVKGKEQRKLSELGRKEFEDENVILD